MHMFYLWPMRMPIILFALMSSGSIIAQGPDRASMQIRTSPDTNLETITIQLVESAKADVEKIEAIYQFVISRISYDHEAYRGGKRRINRSNKDVLRRGKAVCWGYAELIREMCTYAGLICETVSGYAKGAQIPESALEKANHAWNAVFLDDTWYLLDATWGSGIQYADDYFASRYGIDYFLTPPELFVKSHLPLLPMWQLLDCPVSFEAFNQGSVEANLISCNYHFSDSITSYIKLPPLHQRAKTMLVAYDLNQSELNRTQVGHAMIDVAIDEKEKSDLLMERDSHALAIEHLEAALQLFEMAKSYCTFYPWQEESHLFSAINLAQSYYENYYQDSNRYDLVRTQFLMTRDLLAITPLKKATRIQVSALIDQYLNVIH